MKSLYFLSIFLLFLSCSRNVKTDEFLNQKNIQTHYFTIKKFVDGDTFWVNDGSRKGIKIRLIGVDTPENQARFGKPEEYYGDEASKYTKQLLLNKKVRLEYDKDRIDSFGRTLAYVYLEDGTFLNAKLIENGYAEVMTVEPNHKYQNLFLKLEINAKKMQLGVWRK